MRGKFLGCLFGWGLGGALALAQIPDVVTAPGYIDPPSVAVSHTGGGGAYGGVEYLLYRFRDGPAPSLIQIISDADSVREPIPEGAARTVFGNGINNETFNGVRGTFGYWLTPDRCYGIEFSFSQFETRTDGYYIESPGSPVISRYYRDVTGPPDRSTFVQFFSEADGSISGIINAASSTRLWDTDLNVRIEGNCVFGTKFDYLVGFRYLDLRENLTITDRANFNDSGPATFTTGIDHFGTTNQFYGAQIGFNNRFEYQCSYVDITGKFAIGANRERVSIQGQRVFVNEGLVEQVSAGSFLTGPSNIGNYSRNRFAVLPELQIKFGYKFTQNLSANIGYNVFALTNVVRPGSAIDEGINPNNVIVLQADNPGTQARPSFSFNGTDFWAQGLSLGLVYNY